MIVYFVITTISAGLITRALMYLSQKETGLIRRISFNFLMQRLSMHQIFAINTDFAVVVQLFRMVKKVCNIK